MSGWLFFMVLAATDVHFLDSLIHWHLQISDIQMI